MSRFRRLRLLPSLALLVAAGCSPPDSGGGAPEGALNGRLIITGSSTVAPLAREIGRAYETVHPGVRVDVQTGGSSRGIADVRRGTAQVGMISRALGPGEGDLTGVVIARDGIAMIVHASNPVAVFSETDVVGIYTGAISRWSHLGGVDEEITVVHKADGRSTLEVFLDYFGLDNRDVRPSLIIGDNQQGIRTVASDPHAVAYVSVGTALDEVFRGTSIRMVPLGSWVPTLESVRDGSFPLSRPLVLVVQETDNSLAWAFLDFATSSAVHPLVEALYFVPPDS